MTIIFLDVGARIFIAWWPGGRADAAKASGLPLAIERARAVCFDDDVPLVGESSWIGRRLAWSPSMAGKMGASLENEWRTYAHSVLLLTR